MPQRSDSAVAALSPGQQALLLRLLERRAGGGEAREKGIPRRTVEGPCPLSFAQQRLWFVHHLDEGSAAYNSPVAFAVTGALDTEALERGLDLIRRRHESLRTVFPLTGGVPTQLVQPPAPLHLPVVDLAGLPEQLREELAREIAGAEAERPFDLAAGGLFRAALLRLAPDRHILLLNLHHIVFDGWSLGVFLRELAASYDAFRTGTAPALAPLPIQYADFAVWQRERLQGQVLERLTRFWTQHLHGAPPVLALPLDRPRPEVQTWKGGRVTRSLPQELLASARSLAAAEGVSLFMVFLAAFEALLHAWSGQSDVVLGVDSAGRNRVETEGLIGFLVNILPLRVQVHGRGTFRELLGRVRQVGLEAYAHEDLPFDKIVEVVRPERSVSYAPLVQVLFAFQNAPLPGGGFSGLRLQPLEVGHRRSKMDLVLSLTEIEPGATVAWTYNTDLFLEETITRVAAAYEALLARVVADPEVRLDAVQLFPASYRRSTNMVENLEQRDLRSRRSRGGSRRALDLSEVNLVRTSLLRPDEPLPLVVEPGAPDVDLAEWAAGSLPWIEERLLEHGALLFHGFRLRDVAEFERFAASVCPELFGDYGDLPPEKGSTRIYRSTPYPQDAVILFHNESSHLSRWPVKQFFFCLQAAEQGGETPLVDCRRMYRALPPEIVSTFAEKGLRYVRNFTDGLDVSWQDFLRTSGRAEAEERCRQAALDFEWKPDGGLRIHHLSPAVATHPKTGEKIFFNQVQLHHIYFLSPEVRSSMLASFGEENLPRHVYYGDGTPIPDEVMEVVGRTYWDNCVTFPWTEGDVILLDNMLVAHARNPFVGQRRITVAMGEMFEQADLRS